MGPMPVEGGSRHIWSETRCWSSNSTRLSCSGCNTTLDRSCDRGFEGPNCEAFVADILDAES